LNKTVENKQFNYTSTLQLAGLLYMTVRFFMSRSMTRI